jgi:orotidine-5'-phosphate decarboxylase
MSDRTTIPIIALDRSTSADALAIVDGLGEACGFYKVGNELFTAAGPAVVRELRGRGVDVFLDLKFHDIPNTVAHGVANAASLGARLVTVHAAGGEAMVRAAAEAARRASEASGVRCEVLAVTVLTSLTPAELASAWGRTGSLVAMDEVLRLTELAVGAGADGVVCSGWEAAEVRARYGKEVRILVPGVRPPESARDDQARVVTPAGAAAAGANYIVVGRPVTAAADRRQAMDSILAELSLTRS